jgi:hypothetical protein
MHQERQREPFMTGKRVSLALLLGVFLLVIAPSFAPALVSFDFETPFLVHPDQQVWDFCLVRHEGQYNVFYHTIPPLVQNPAAADTIWHAVSSDLRRWEILGPAVTSGPGWWDEAAIWAPDVVFDENTGRWAMLYTGVGQGMVQRACLAWSTDLATWEKSAANPVFEPDSVTYYWSPSQNWSSFRDPFLYYDGQAWNMLSTAHLRLGGEPDGRRAIVHRSVSNDLENWQDAGAFFEHDGAIGQTYDFESVQYLVRDGWHHLFFTEQDPTIEHHYTSHLMATDPSGWTMADRTIVDAGWAPEIKPFTTRTDTDIFARLTKGQDPRDGSWFVTAKFDSIRFGPDGQAPEVIAADLLGPDWPTRSGETGAAAPTFGENPTWRGAAGIQVEGHGWFGSRENYSGPLSGTGQPGAMLGDVATGRLESRPFVLTGDYFRLRIAGGNFPTSCFVGLEDDATGENLTRINPRGETVLTLKQWDVRGFRGRTVRMVLVDEESGSEGWIAVDAIEEFGDTSPVEDSGYRTSGGTPAIPVTGLAAHPNPFNSGTVIRFDLDTDGGVRLEIYDLGGRRIWHSEEIQTTAGEMRVAWNGRDQDGRNLPSGTYFCRVFHEGTISAGVRLTLVK